MALELVPVSHAQANAYVAAHHRHNGRLPASKFCLAVANESQQIVGVAIAGIPKARHFDDGWTLEVNRVCTEGYPNAGSKLYGAYARAAFALGYRRVITYSLASESGTTMRAAGWRVVAERPARKGWSTLGRPRVNEYHSEARTLWEVTA